MAGRIIRARGACTITLYHQLALLDKLPGPETRRWYAAHAIQHNWSRNVLVMQIESRLLERNRHEFPGHAAPHRTPILPVNP